MIDLSLDAEKRVSPSWLNSMSRQAFVWTSRVETSVHSSLLYVYLYKNKNNNSNCYAGKSELFYSTLKNSTKENVSH